MHEKRYDGGVERLRSAERLKMLEIEKVVELVLEGIQADSVLDVGTGSGLFAEAFQKRGLQVAGVDVSPKMLAAAEPYVPGADLRDGVAEALPFAEGFCDLVFMGLLLHETDLPGQALKEARRVGKKRTAVLEWPYDPDQEFGPPLAHRLPARAIEQWSTQAGFARFEIHTLKDLVLYILDVA